MPSIQSCGGYMDARWEDARWECLPLSRVAAIHQGLLLSRYQDESEPEYPIVNVRNLEQLRIGGELSVAQVKIPNPEYVILAGDVVTNLRGTAFRASVAPPNVQGSLAGQNLAVLRPAASLNSLYLAMLLRSQWFQRQMSTLYVQSTGTQLLTLSNLKSLQIPVPDLQTQNRLAELALATEQTTQAIRETIAARERLAEGVLASVLEGRR